MIDSPDPGLSSYRLEYDSLNMKGSAANKLRLNNQTVRPVSHIKSQILDEIFSTLSATKEKWNIFPRCEHHGLSFMGI